MLLFYDFIIVNEMKPKCIHSLDFCAARILRFPETFKPWEG